MLQVWRCETKGQVPCLWSIEPSADRYRVGRWCVKNRERKSKQGTHASITGAEQRPHVPGRDSQSPKVRSNPMPLSFSRLYHETHPLLLQGSIVERGVEICSEYHFRYVTLITSWSRSSTTLLLCPVELFLHLSSSQCQVLRASVYMFLPVWHTQPSRKTSILSPPLVSSSCTAHEVRSQWDKSMEVVHIPSLPSGRESLCWGHLR